MSTDTTPTTARPRRKRALLLTGLGVLVVAAIVAAVVLVQRPSSAQPKDDKVSVETATVTRGELTEQLRAQGTLGFSSLRDVGTTLSGIVTGVPAGGTVITAGQELFRVNDSPVVLLHGDLPVWRAFREGMTDGEDVLQLERTSPRWASSVAPRTRSSRGTPSTRSRGGRSRSASSRPGWSRPVGSCSPPRMCASRPPKAAVGDAAQRGRRRGDRHHSSRCRRSSTPPTRPSPRWARR